MADTSEYRGLLDGSTSSSPSSSQTSSNVKSSRAKTVLRKVGSGVKGALGLGGKEVIDISSS